MPLAWHPPRQQNYRDSNHAAKWPLKVGSLMSPYGYSLLFVRLGQDQRPIDFVFRGWRVNRGYAHAGRTRQQHVGPMRVRVAPAGKRLGEGVISGTDVFGCSLGIVARCFQPLHEWLARPMVNLVAPGHYFR